MHTIYRRLYSIQYRFLSLPFILLYELHVAVREGRHDLFQIPGDSVAPSVCALGRAEYWAGLDSSQCGFWPQDASLLRGRQVELSSHICHIHLFGFEHQHHSICLQFFFLFKTQCCQKVLRQFFSVLSVYCSTLDLNFRNEYDVEVTLSCCPNFVCIFGGYFLFSSNFNYTV